MLDVESSAHWAFSIGDLSDVSAKTVTVNSQTELKNALEEDETLAIKCLFYLRDIRGGQGERRFFRVCFNWLAKNYPEIARRNLVNLAEYGRYDDLFVGLKTNVDKELVALIQEQLDKDILSKTENGTCSLLAKWMPSVNASNSDTIHTALYLANRLNLCF